MVTVVCVRVVTVIECAIGGLPKSGKFTCWGHTFQGCWLLRVKGKFYALLLIGINVMFNNRVCYRGSSEMSQIHVLGSHFWRLLVTASER